MIKDNFQEKLGNWRIWCKLILRTSKKFDKISAYLSISLSELQNLCKKTELR